VFRGEFEGEESPMRWRNMRESDNIEDRQGRSSGGFGLGGGVKLGGLGLVAVVAISLLLGQNPLEILSMLVGDGSVTTAPAPSSPGAPGPVRDEGKEFVARIVGDTEDTWGKIFQQMGRRYEAPRLVLFRGRVESACGLASSAVGPFYCPGDSQVYLDQAFFQELKNRFGAPGDFARAYVIAHEVGHHVQNQLGIAQRVDQQRARLGPASRNALSVRMELQADCFAGVWGYYARQRGLLEPGDLESGLTAAAAIGDDRLQQQTQGSVRPETFTHGSSAQRVGLFKTGFESGDPRQCDTFTARER
jgi:predicted metalloprotease